MIKSFCLKFFKIFCSIPIPLTQAFSPIAPSSSYFRVVVPLNDEHFPLRLKYRRYDGGVRMGRCLEDLDTIAGIASYLHNGQMGHPGSYYTLFNQQLINCQLDTFILSTHVLPYFTTKNCLIGSSFSLLFVFFGETIWLFLK